MIATSWRTTAACLFTITAFTQTPPRVVALSSRISSPYNRPNHLPACPSAPLPPPGPSSLYPSKVKRTPMHSAARKTTTRSSSSSSSTPSSTSAASAAPNPAQLKLVNYLIASRLVETPRVAEALKHVDRKLFVDPSFADTSKAYEDAPAPIGFGQTISAPHMHAVALELLQAQAQPGARVLDVGSGSGYLVACFAKMVRPGGHVLGLEKVPELATRSEGNIEAACPDLAREKNESWRIVHGNALSEVLAEEGLFNAIHVGAAAETIPRELVEKLATGGRMIVPVGLRHSLQELMSVEKDGSGRVTARALMGVGYVPLTRPGEE